MRYFLSRYLHKKPINNRFQKISFILVIVILCGFPFYTFGQQAISLPEAIERTLSYHPDLKTYDYQKQVFQGTVQQAGAKSIPQINLTLEEGFGTGDYSGLRQAQTSLSISWLLDQKLIKSRVNTALVESKRLPFERESKVLDLAAKTADYFIAALINQEKLAIAQQANQQTYSHLKAIAKRVAVGKSSGVDKLRAKAKLAQQKLITENIQQQLVLSKQQLFSQWQGAIKNIPLQGKLRQLSEIPKLGTLQHYINNNPQIKLFSIQKDIAQSKINLARISARPSWELTAGIRRSEATNDYALLAGISIPFGGKNRYQGKIQALKAKQQQYQAESEAWKSALSVQLSLLIAQLNYDKRVIKSLEKQVIPLLKQAVRKAKQAYYIGQYSYTEWSVIQQDLFKTQMELIDVYHSFHLNNIELERLTGRILPAR